MELAVFGATGGTGKEFVRQALDSGHEITALIHQTDIDEQDNLEIIKGDVRDYEDVEKVVEGSDAVVSMIGSEIGGRPVCAEGVTNMIEAMGNHGISRLIVESAYGAGQPRKGIYPFILRLMIRPLIKDKEDMEERLERSDLNYTVVRPSILTNGPLTGNYIATENYNPRGIKPSISRADTAEFLLKELEEPNFEKKTVTLSSK